MYAAAVAWAAPIDRYRVLYRIGERPSGTAYLAEDRPSGRRVAVHVACWSARHETARASRLRESTALVGRVAHRHVLAVLDLFFTEDGCPCLVTEHVEGGSLVELVAARGGWLPPHEAVSIACEVLEGLAALHLSGMVHGALVPASVRICPDERGVPLVKLADVATASGLPDPRRLRDGGAAWMRADVFAVASLLEGMIAGARRSRPAPGKPSVLSGASMRALDGVLAEALGARRGFETAEAMLHALRGIDLAGFDAAREDWARTSPDLGSSGVRPVSRGVADAQQDALATTQAHRVAHGRRGRRERAVFLAVLVAGALMSALLCAVLMAALR